MKKFIIRIMSNYGSLFGTLIAVVIPSVIIIIAVQYVIYRIRQKKNSGK